MAIIPDRDLRYAGTPELDLAAGPTWLGGVSFADPRVPRISIVPHPSTTPADVVATVVRAERTHPAPYLDYEILRPTAPAELALTRLLTGLFGLGRYPHRARRGRVG